MVTSSAVVGSSAISSFGLQASAIAIITRWRMPPESWCGYSRTRRCGSGMPTSVSISIACASAACASQALMQPQRLADLAADRQHRVEARHRLLEDHRDVVAADVAHLAARTVAAGRVPSKRMRAGDLARRLGDQPQDRHRGDRLAAAGFADDGQRLAGVDVEGDAVDRADRRRPGVREMGLEVLDFEQRHRAQSRFGQRGSSASRRPSPSRFTASTVMRQEHRREEHDVGLDLPQRAALGHDVAPGRDDRRRAGADEGQDRLGDHGRGADEGRLHHHRRQRVGQDVRAG